MPTARKQRTGHTVRVSTTRYYVTFGIGNRQQVQADIVELIKNKGAWALEMLATVRRSTNALRLDQLSVPTVAADSLIHNPSL